MEACAVPLLRTWMSQDKCRDSSSNAEVLIRLSKSNANQLHSASDCMLNYELMDDNHTASPVGLV